MNQGDFPFLALVFSLSLLGCEGKSVSSASTGTEGLEKAEEGPAAPSAPVSPKPKGPPELVVDDISPRIGFSRVIIKEERDRAQLAAELMPHRDELSGKEADIVVDRKASIRIVAMFLEELGQVGVVRVRVQSDTRPDFPSKVTFVPLKQAKPPAPCSPVVAILEDRGTAVWRAQGGTASKRAKGLGGPDLSTTSETLNRFIKGCDARRLYVAAPEAVGWGLLFDLASSVFVLPEHKPEAVILLAKNPVPGHKVEFD